MYAIMNSTVFGRNFDDLTIGMAGARVRF